MSKEETKEEKNVEFKNEFIGLKKVFEEMIGASGGKLGIGTKECQQWQREHSNCFGCPSALGCRKMFELRLWSLHMCTIPSTFGYETFEHLADWIVEILDAKTMEELEQVSRDIKEDCNAIELSAERDEDDKDEHNCCESPYDEGDHCNDYDEDDDYNED